MSLKPDRFGVLIFQPCYKYNLSGYKKLFQLPQREKPYRFKFIATGVCFYFAKPSRIAIAPGMSQ
jgi:hypothetical protein